MTLTPALPVFSRLAMQRRAVRSGCAMAIALALAVNPGTVTAQSFLGNGVPTGGEATIIPSAGITDIIVTSPEVVINWELPSSPLGGNPPEVFQPAGTTANFIAGSSNGFTVLNRILPTDDGGAPVNRAALLNGTVNGPSNSSIWFYSPSGIVIGSTASFNVGSLVLTSNDIDTADGLYGPNGDGIRFRGPESSLAPVEIQAGAVINAGIGQGNYLAIVAPRIVQAGTITVDGHIALVAAEQADIRVNVGLLDIVVTQGTTDPNGIIHTGSTGGPASFASDDFQALSLIAMPKNTALTMLLSGSLGYTPAASAQDEGSTVVLSAGHAFYLPDDVLGQNLGSISIDNSQFTSAVTGIATNAISIAPTGGSVQFEQAASFTALRSISATAGAGESIIAGDSLRLHAVQGVTGGTVNVLADGGTIDVHTLYASASALAESAGDPVGLVTGGTATVGAANGGVIRATGIFGAPGSITVEADAVGSGPAQSNALGGTATLFASDGALVVEGDILVSASAMGSPFGNEGSLDTGFAAQGGTATVELSRGSAGTASLSAAGISIVANGNAEAENFGIPLATGGIGTGGTAQFVVGAGTFNAGTLTVQADGRGGSGEIGGNGVGGTAAFLLNDGSAGAAQRSIGSLTLLGRGIAGISASGPAATTIAGQTLLVANTGSAAGAVAIAGDFNAEATGEIAPAGNGFVADVGGSAFTIGGNTAITTSRDVAITVTAGGTLATQRTLSIATPRSVTSTGLVRAAAGATISANLGISMSDLQSSAATQLSAFGGRITVSNDLSSAGLVTLMSPAANIRSLGTLSLGDVSGSGDFSVEAGGDLLTAALAMTGNVTLGSGGTLRIGGLILGTNITATSGDIVMGPNGSIGQRGITQSITLLNANPASTTFIGGGAQQGGYSLDAAEATRLFADGSISLGVPMSAGPGAADLVIGDLSLAYGAAGQIGAGGILKINAPGRIRVNGQVALSTSSSADRFSIDPTRIEINTDTGGIAMQDANGGLLGQLELVAGTIAVASGATLAAIANLSNPTDINTALDAAAVNPSDAGYLRAGSITLNATDAIYVANTGASTENAARRGFSANSLSLITGSPDTHVSINGVLVAASGAAITGQDALSRITVNGAPATMLGRFSASSTINGCALGAQNCNAPLTPEITKTKSDIEVPLDPEGNKPQFTYVFEIDEREADDQQPLVDEPVTGVGNDDLWNGVCGPDGVACSQGGNSQ